MTAPHALSWILAFLRWLTPRRLQAQAIVLALCLWGVAVVDFSTPGALDRAGNIKFHDFLPIYVAGRLVSQDRALQLYDQKIAADERQSILGESVNVRLPFLYSPQVALFFAPIARLSFSAAARIWVALSLLIYYGCVYAVWRSCPSLQAHARLVAISAVAFPPLFHFFVRGQLSALILLCITVAYLAFRAEQSWLAGAALGFLVFKPQFLVAIPLILLFAGAWKAFFGIIASATAQLVITYFFFGAATMQKYFDLFLHPSGWIDSAELSLAPIQMHSLRSFFSLLIPWPSIALVFYGLSSVTILLLAVWIWRSSNALSIRFSALILAAVLINPHLFVYDLLVLAPALLLLTDATLNAEPELDRSREVLQFLLYLAFVLPLIGPISRWTHVQLSVIVFVAILWILHRTITAGHKFASAESAVV